MGQFAQLRAPDSQAESGELCQTLFLKEVIIE
jgi:hypothetical protein